MWAYKGHLLGLGLGVMSDSSSRRRVRKLSRTLLIDDTERREPLTVEERVVVVANEELSGARIRTLKPTNPASHQHHARMSRLTKPPVPFG